MTTQPAPLLTAELADKYAKNFLFDGSTPFQRATQALADGRTVNVRVMSEDECRAEFEARFVTLELRNFVDVEGETVYVSLFTENAWMGWRTCARAMGAVKSPIVVCDECGAVSNDNHREDCMYTGEVR